MNKKNKILIISSIIVIILLVFSVLFIDKDTNANLKNEEKSKEVYKKQFAIMLQNNTGDYEASENNTFPSSGYDLNTTLTNCTDENGTKLENTLKYENGNIAVRTNQKIYCYLYFDLTTIEENSVVINLGDEYTTSTSVFLNLLSEDATEMCISESETCTEWESYTSYKMFTLSDTVGQKTVYVTYRDGSGKTIETVNDTILLYEVISVTPSQNGSLTYTGSSQSPTWVNYDSNKLTIGGTTSSTNAGSYNATFTPKTNYVWSDGTSVAKTVSWSIGKATITVPTQSGSLTYTGSSQTPSWNNYNSTQLTLGGTTSGTNAGSYNATFTPKANYVWSDGTSTAKTVAWSIGKTAGSLTVSPTTLTIGVGKTGTITATRSGNGTVSATSSSTSVATVSVSGTTITVTGKASGSATITVSVAAGTNHSAPSNKTVSVTVSNPSLGQYLIDNSISGLHKSKIGTDTLYRFSGTSGNTGINNYICLGTTSKCASGSENMYRIIGVEPSTGYVKVIKQTNYGENIQWNFPMGVTWPNSNAYTKMTTWYNSVSFKSMIVSHSWNIGDVEGKTDTYVGTRSTVMSYEDNTTTTAYVGMLALSDYYLAYRGDQNWISSNGNYTSNWIHLVNNGNTNDAEWTMSRYNSNYVWFVYNHGRGGVSEATMPGTGVVRPAFYLNSTVNRISGSGTSTDPFLVSQ